MVCLHRFRPIRVNIELSAPSRLVYFVYVLALRWTVSLFPTARLWQIADCKFMMTELATLTALVWFLVDYDLQLMSFLILVGRKK